MNIRKQALFVSLAVLCFFASGIFAPLKAHAATTGVLSESMAQEQAAANQAAQAQAAQEAAAQSKAQAVAQAQAKAQAAAQAQAAAEAQAKAQAAAEAQAKAQAAAEAQAKAQAAAEAQAKAQAAQANASQIGTTANNATVAAMVAQINQVRVSRGLAPLQWDGELAQAAGVRAAEQAQTFGHTRPDGSAWFTVNSARVYGENLAMAYGSDQASGQAVTASWFSSPLHAAILQDGGFTTIGISVYQGPGGACYYAAEFGY